MKIKTFLILFLFILSLAQAEKIKVLREDIPDECFYFKTWCVEDSFYKEESLNKNQLKVVFKEKGRYISILDIVTDEEFKKIDLRDDSKWEEILVKKVKYVLINI